MALLNYGQVCVSTIDPIEKKPLFHFLPGSKVLSLGTFGCNLRCLNCQNALLVNATYLPSVEKSAEEVVEEAIRGGAQGIAFTFNEPIVWFEFILEVSKVAEAKGLFVILNTNGYIQAGPAEVLFSGVKAMNIDVKGFSEEFYEANCGGHLSAVLRTCSAAKKEGVHVELTYLLIPGLNDSAEEIGAFCDWVVQDMGIETPLHFFRFSPSHKLALLPEQSLEKMNEAYEIACKKGIRYVYFGGVTGSERQNTYCPSCQLLLIRRNSVKVTDKVCFKGSEVSRFCPTFNAVKASIDNNKCPSCGEPISVLLIVKP